MRPLRAASWIAAGALAGVWASLPAAALGAGAAIPLAALVPGQAACASAQGALTLAADRSGYGTRSSGGPPVWLSPGALAYLQSARRPVPHVAALVAARTTGQTVWRVPLAPAAAPTTLAVLGGDLALAVRQGAGVRVELFTPLGRRAAAASVPWPVAGLGPALTADGRSGLLVSGAAANLPAALGGVGTAATPILDLGPDLSVRWRSAADGDLVALGGGVAVAAVRVGTAGAAVRLTALSVATGATLWRRTLDLAQAPDTASFVTARGVLLWSATWRSGGGVGALVLASGHVLWRAGTEAPAWIVVDGTAVGGTQPWQAPEPMVGRTLATGRLVWRGPGAAPVAAMGGRILAIRAVSSGTRWLWVVPPGAAGGAPAAEAPRGAANLAPEPPVAVYCGPGVGQATLLAAARGGDLWRVGSAAPGKEG